MIPSSEAGGQLGRAKRKLKVETSLGWWWSDAVERAVTIRVQRTVQGRQEAVLLSTFKFALASVTNPASC